MLDYPKRREGAPARTCRARGAHRTWLRILVAVVAALAAACGPPPKPADLPDPIDATTIDVGDEFELHIINEDQKVTEFVVAPDGTVDVPLAGRVHVGGLEPQAVSAAVRARIIALRKLTDPIVSVKVKSYNSKRVEVLGEVKSPGSLALEPGMTLVRAISKAGGFTPLASKSRVTIRRKVKDGVKAVEVDVEAIMDNEIPDVPLQAGDTIFVAQRVA
ncbi:MAG: polysaccharide export protein [Myxococcales bacterium]|nr:polysaccharide export protein [Myxococcales bacterium]